MRREHIRYMENIPVNIELLDIREYPIHWHEAIEILMILKGSIEVAVESDTYRLIENEVEIINLDEAHSLSSNEPNLVLMLHIDPSFFQKYYEDIRNIYFYTDCAFEGEPQIGENYEIFKKHLSTILCEAVQKGEDYDVYIRETLVELLYLLINEFHYLIYENRDLKDNVEQLQRYHRIAKYIFNNYNNKISLQDIAKKEFLSAQYLSNEIKYALGISFQDFVNLTRAEESVKLLLDTDMSISEISEEVGFSHTRYYNKHFKRHYKMTPLQYRKKYKMDEEKFNNTKQITSYDLGEALKYISSYLENYERYNYEEKIAKINVDVYKNEGEFFHTYKDAIILPKASAILEKEVQEFLITIQKEIDFDYGILKDLFSKEMGIHPEGNINFRRVKRVIDLILSIDLRPDIIFDFEEFTPLRYQELLTNFLNYFQEEYGTYELSKWRYSIQKNASEKFKRVFFEILGDEWGFAAKEEDIKDYDLSSAYDMASAVPYIINGAINNTGSFVFKAIDELAREKNMENAVFFGDKGLLNWEGIKKPAYHAFYFLSKLGDTVIEKGEGYIVTSKGEDFQVILYTSDELAKTEDEKRDAAGRNFSLNIVNLWRDYRVVIYEASENTNSAYDLWKAMGEPLHLADNEVELLKLATIPKITTDFRKKKPVQHFNLKIRGSGAILLTFYAI